VEDGAYGEQSSGEEPLSGYLAVTATTSARSTLALQVSRGHRLPTLSDLYYVGISGRGYVTGNPELVPETSRQADLAWRGRGERWTAAASAYHYRIDDLVERIRLPVPGRQYTFRNAGQAEITGVEVEGSGRLAAGLVLRAGAQHARGTIEGEDSPPDDVPGLSGFLRLDREWRTIRAGVRLAAFARDERPGPGEVVVPGYAVTDLTFGWRPRSGIDLDLAVGNLFDRSYPAAPEEGAPEAPGRSAALAVTVRWPRPAAPAI